MYEEWKKKSINIEDNKKLMHVSSYDLRIIEYEISCSVVHLKVEILLV